MFNTIAQFSPNQFIIQTLNNIPPPPPLLSLSPLFANTGKTIPSKNANFLAGIQHPHSKLDQLYTGQQGLASLMQEQDLHGKTLANWQHISVPTSHNV